MNMQQVDRYKETRVEVVSTLKEGAISSLLANYVVKSEALEGAPMVDVEETFSSDSNEKAPTSTTANAASLVYLHSRYA